MTTSNRCRIIGKSSAILLHYTRTSYGYIELAETLRPFDVNEQGNKHPLFYTPDEKPIFISRRWSNALIISLTGASLDTLQDDAMKQLALSLCMLFHDTLVSIYPAQASNLAVISPQTGEIERESLLDIIGSETLPLLISPDVDKTGWMPGGSGSLDLVLIEDSDIDLGVVRSIKDDYGQVAEIILDYLDWAFGQEESSLYHCCGAEKLPDCIDYAGVKALLETLNLDRGRMRRTAQRQRMALPDADNSKRACDFCALQIHGQRYEMQDGRIQCGSCHDSAIMDLDVLEGC